MSHNFGKGECDVEVMGREISTLFAIVVSVISNAGTNLAPLFNELFPAMGLESG
jgi:hypothetical protein